MLFTLKNGLAVRFCIVSPPAIAGKGENVMLVATFVLGIVAICISVTSTVINLIVLLKQLNKKITVYFCAWRRVNSN